MDSSLSNALPDTNNLRIFVAEDSQFIRVRIAALIAGCPGVQCVGWADSICDTIAGVRELHPHGLILDLQLKDGSGLNVLRTVSAQRPMPRIVVCTNWATEQHRTACCKAGAERVLDKSSEFTELRNVVVHWATCERSPINVH